MGAGVLADRDGQAQWHRTLCYLGDVLRRMVDGHPASHLDELLPWNWAAADVNT